MVKFPAVKFDIDEEIVNRLARDIRGLVVAVTYHSDTYWTYTVQWATGVVSNHKEKELMTIDEFLTENEF